MNTRPFVSELISAKHHFLFEDAGGLGNVVSPFGCKSAAGEMKAFFEGLTAANRGLARELW